MSMQLIEGHFSPQEAIEIITKMVQVKIKFQEEKITPECSEENIKMREQRIARLQNQLHEVVQYIGTKKESVDVRAMLEVA